MAAYTVSIERRAQKALALLPDRIYRRVTRVIEGLAAAPRPSGAKALQGEARHLRIRVGDYRIVYAVSDDDHRVFVTGVGHRRDVYRR